MERPSRLSVRDVTGDEEHFGPEEKRTDRVSVEDPDSYNTPRRTTRPVDGDEKSNNEGRRETRCLQRETEPTEGDIRKKKEEYSEDDFKGEVTAGGGGDETLIPEDVYEVKCIDVIPKMMKDNYKGGIEVPKVILKFEIINDPDFEGVTKSRVLNRNFAIKSHLVTWYMKITGEATEKGNSIDVRKCKGKECRISVIVTVNKESGEQKNKIVDVLAKKKRAQ